MGSYAIGTLRECHESLDLPMFAPVSVPGPLELGTC